MMPLSGVRSSWDMLARNSLLRRLASCKRRSLEAPRSRGIAHGAATTNRPSSVWSGLRLISTGNSVAVLAQPAQRQPGAHARARVGWPKRPVRWPRMCRAVPLAAPGPPPGGPSSVFARPAEQQLGLGIDEDDPARLVHDDHGIRRGLEQAAELALGTPAGFLGGPVMSRTAHNHQALVAVQRAEADLERELLAAEAPRPKSSRPAPMGRVRGCARKAGAVAQVRGDRVGSRASTGCPSARRRPRTRTSRGPVRWPATCGRWRRRSASRRACGRAGPVARLDGLDSAKDLQRGHVAHGHRGTLRAHPECAAPRCSRAGGRRF